MRFLKSLLFNLIFYPIILIASIQVVILFPFININRLQKVASFWIIVILKILKLICGVSWKVKGLGNIKDQPCILVSNHQGVWESFFIQTLIYPSYNILKKELLSSYLFVLPSLYSEGCPTSIMEAMQYKIPCVAYDICGINELIIFAE